MNPRELFGIIPEEQAKTLSGLKVHQCLSIAAACAERQMLAYKRFNEITGKGSFLLARKELDQFWSAAGSGPSRRTNLPVEESRRALDRTVSPPEIPGRGEGAFLQPHALWTTWTLISCVDVVSKTPPQDGALSAMRYARDSVSQYVQCSSAKLQSLAEEDIRLAAREARRDEHFTREVARELADIEDVRRGLDVEELKARAARDASTFISFPVKYILPRR